VQILVTGAAGFVGRPLLAALAARGHGVTALVRSAPGVPLSAGRIVPVGDVSAIQDWRPLLAGADCVIHLAARTHTADAPGADTDALYEMANVTVTERLARAALEARVRRFVYVSSIKVNGEETFGTPFRASDEPAPEDAYGRSKARAESVLRSAASGSLELVVLRPPLMVGPGVKGNVAQLFRWAARGLPLPLRSIANRRDMLGVTSFADLVAIAAENPAAAGGTFLARDGAPVSTPELYRAIGEALGTRPPLLPCPVALLKLAGAALGRGDAIRKVVGDLEVDDSETRRLLGWQPSVSLKDELAATARAFRGV
jgi:nucleoside-diphosphate-sugar epimerase